MNIKKVMSGTAKGINVICESLNYIKYDANPFANGQLIAFLLNTSNFKVYY